MATNTARLALVIAVGLAGCRRSAPDPCEAGAPVCGDAQTELACDVGKTIATPCRGPLGCVALPGATLCDRSVVLEGDRCEAGTSACSTDHARFLSCEKGAFALASICRGPHGCSIAEGSRIVCDASIGAPGDACATAGLSCSADGNDLLACREGKLVVNGPCRGPERCRAVGDGIACDRSFAEVGEPCDGKGYACSGDRRRMLHCKAGRFVDVAPCRCHIVGDAVRCEERAGQK